MTDEEVAAAWDALDVDTNTATRIYGWVIKGLPKEMFHLTEDEAKAWDLIADDLKEFPAPEGSTYAIPNE